MLFGVIGDEWDGLDAATVVQEIRGLGDAAQLEVLINSPGGIVTDGLAIYNELVTNPIDVTIDIVGLAASMASAIAMAGDRIRIASNAMIMIHNPWNMAIGDAEDLRKAAEVLDKFGTSLAGIYATRTGLGEEEIREMMDAETWLNADEAFAKGFVDEIVEPTDASAFADLDVGELTAVPAALTALIREGRNMTRKIPAAPAADPNDPPAPAAAAPAPAPAAAPAPDADAIRANATQAERERQDAIRALGSRLELPDTLVTELVNAGNSIEDANAAAIDWLADAQQARDGGTTFPGGSAVVNDERDKFMAGAAAWLIQKAGKSRAVEAHTGEDLDPGEFRGMTLLELARESLHRSGASTRGLSKIEIARAALSWNAPMSLGLNTRSDFPVLLENVLHKMLQASYALAPNTWRGFCAEGSVSDFRPHPRLRLGTFSALSDKLESGEFKQKHFPDAEKETIQAATKGNIVGITREALVNDDVDGFSRLVSMLGRAAGLTIESDVYALLAENSGLGPTMGDGDTLFHANHNNIGAGAALTAAAIDADRVIMASQRDPEGNEYLDIRPSALVVPIGLGSTARQINEAQYDPDSVGDLKPNTVRGLFQTVVDTPRLSGTRRYLFADPAVVPTIEVVFLDGQSAPQIIAEEGFDYDGVRWRIHLDFGVDATDWRGAVTDAGA